MINFDLTKIKALAFDIDGVLSTNIVRMENDGAGLMRTANIKDGYALQLAVKCGLQLAIVTGGNSEAIRNRYEQLGVQHIFQRAAVKINVFRDWGAQIEVQPQDVLYMGDDIPDFEVMKECGLPVCPADAAAEIKAIATYVSHLPGGCGCVRDVIEQVLKAQNHWMSSARAFGW